MILFGEGFDGDLLSYLIFFSLSIPLANLKSIDSIEEDFVTSSFLSIFTRLFGFLFLSFYICFVTQFVQRLSYRLGFNLLKKLVLVDISVSEKSTDSDTCSELA